MVLLWDTVFYLLFSIIFNKNAIPAVFLESKSLSDNVAKTLFRYFIAVYDKMSSNNISIINYIYLSWKVINDYDNYAIMRLQNQPKRYKYLLHKKPLILQ